MTPEELAKRFDAAGDEFLDIKLKLLKRMTITVEGEAKKHPPTPSDTSTMRRSITHRVEPTASHGVVGTFGRKGKNVGYARYVHEGTSKMPARPFLKWALDSSRAQFDVFIEQAGDELMARIAEGG